MIASAAIPRLGIPACDWWNEALHGVARNGTAIVYPQAITLAATWNPGLLHRVADSISTEARAQNAALLADAPGLTGATTDTLTIAIDTLTIATPRPPTPATTTALSPTPAAASSATPARSTSPPPPALRVT
jgi:hypothetical protein